MQWVHLWCSLRVCVKIIAENGSLDSCVTSLEKLRGIENPAGNISLGIKRLVSVTLIG